MDENWENCQIQYDCVYETPNSQHLHKNNIWESVRRISARRMKGVILCTGSEDDTAQQFLESQKKE